MKFTANETGGNFSETAYGSTSLTTSYSTKLSTSSAFFAQYEFNLLYLQRGNKHYELTNHTSTVLSTGLGNVLAVITDKRLLSCMGDTIQSSSANIVSATDYSPFGAPLAGRVFSANEYRFGFNGQEKDDEVSGDGNTMTAEFWEYDARLGRRWNLDPIIYDWQSGYACINNNPIYFTDPNGDEPTPDGKQIDNNKSPTPWKVGREHSSLSLPLKEVVITAFKTTPLSSQNQVTVNTDIKCHPGNDFQANELARIQKEYAKLNYSSGQVDLPRNSAWDFLFGKRTYVGGYEVNSKGYLTGKMTPQTGSPDLIGGMGLLKVPSQLANFNRFAKSLPNTATNFSIFDMPNGGKAFQAYVPATNIPGSFAIYEKQIDAAGKTLQMTKTTIDAEGKVVHIRDLLMHQKVYIKP